MPDDNFQYALLSLTPDFQVAESILQESSVSLILLDLIRFFLVVLTESFVEFSGFDQFLAGITLTNGQTVHLSLEPLDIKGLFVIEILTYLE